MDEQALKLAVRKGEKAAKLVESHREYWDELDAEFSRLWCQTKTDEKEKREDIYREYHASKALRAKIQGVVMAGRKAREELEQRKRRNGDGSSARTGSPA